MFRILLGTAIWKVLESDPVMKAALEQVRARDGHTDNLYLAIDRAIKGVMVEYVDRI